MVRVALGALAYYKTSAEYQLHSLLDLQDVHACTPVVLKRRETHLWPRDRNAHVLPPGRVAAGC
jgi:hypothetical protein